MPTNLPPEFYEVDKLYRAAQTVSEKIELLQELLGTIPKHKGTDKLRAGYKRRLAKLKSASQSQKGGSRQESPFHIDKEGAGQVMVIGPANTGKSSLVETLTNAAPEISEVPFSTWQPTPGMMRIENIQVQLVDTPALDRGYVEPEFLGLIRRADLILLVLDLQADPMQQLQNTVNLLKEHRILPLNWQGHVPENRRLTFKPLLLLVNKDDDERHDEDYEIFCELTDEEWPCIPISVTAGRNLERLKQEVFTRLNVMRVFAKPPGKDADLAQPFVLQSGSTVDEFARKIHLDFHEQLKSARVWGSAAYDGQMVGRDYVLQDGDIVELRI